MKLLAAILFLLIAAPAFAQNPSFRSFDQNAFSTNGFVIRLTTAISNAWTLAASNAAWAATNGLTFTNSTLANYTNSGIGDSNSYAKWKLLSGWSSGISTTPVKGFNNYYKTGADIKQSVVSNYAQIMIENGMRDAGYRYIVMDAGVFTNRDVNGNLVPNGNFPNITNFISWLHTNGFKVGIWQENTPDETHSSATSSSTNNHNAFLERDIQYYANLKIDYIKFDTDPAAIKEYDLNRIATDIANTGRPMFLHGATTNYQPWMNQVMNSWRNVSLGDVQGANGLGFLYAYYDYAFTHPEACVPGHFWSFDIVSGLGVGTGFEVHITGVAMWSAELISANVDNSAMWPYYTNVQMLAINDDVALAPPIKISSNNLAEVWVKPLGTRSDGATNKAVAFFNRNSFSTNITVNITNIFPFPPNSTIATMRDVWNQTNAFKTNTITFTVAPTNVVLLTVRQGYQPSLTNTDYINFAVANGITNHQSTAVTFDANFTVTNGLMSIGEPIESNVELAIKSASGNGDLIVRASGSSYVSMSAAEAANTFLSGRDLIFLPDGNRNITFGFIKNFFGHVEVTNVTFATTSAAPTSVTVGTTVPDRWVPFTNSGNVYYFPAWTNH